MLPDASEGCPPFYVVPMPINAEGHGPEMDQTKVVKTEYEIWDQLYMTYFICDTKSQAESKCLELNDLYKVH